MIFAYKLYCRIVYHVEPRIYPGVCASAPPSHRLISDTQGIGGGQNVRHPASTDSHADPGGNGRVSSGGRRGVKVDTPFMRWNVFHGDFRT